MPREDEAVVRSEGRKTRLRANSDDRDNSATVRNVSSVGNSSANSSNSSKWSSNVASSRNAIAIETGMGGAMTGAITIVTTTTGASVTGGQNNSNAPNAIVRTRSDGRVTCTSDSE